MLLAVPADQIVREMPRGLDLPLVWGEVLPGPVRIQEAGPDRRMRGVPGQAGAADLPQVRTQDGPAPVLRLRDRRGLAVRQTNRELIADLRGYAERNCIHELGRLRRTDVSDGLQKEIEEEYREKFKLWWDSWMAPTIKEIERRLVKPKRRKEGNDGTREAGDGRADRDPGPEARDV